MHAESKLFFYLSEIQAFEVPFFQWVCVWKKGNWKNLFDNFIRIEPRIATLDVLLNVQSRKI